jgi:hypothetical protein
MQLITENTEISNVRLDSFLRSFNRYKIKKNTPFKVFRIFILYIENEYFNTILSNSLKRRLSNMSRFIDDFINTYFMFMTLMTPLVFSREVINSFGSLMV